MSVDILAIGENNRKKLQAQQNQSSIINPWRQTPGDVEPISPKTKAQQTLDKQVEIGLGTRLDNVMTNKDKQLYADGLDEGQWNLMQRYKAEGYSFEASKAMVEQNKELLDPYAQGINKFKDYQAKEQYYNNTGGTVDPNSNLYKIGTFLQKIGFDDQYGNPLNKLASQYNEWYMNEREAMDYLKDNGELNLLERFGWWLERGLLSAESGIISGLGKIGNAVQGTEDIKSSAMDAALDRAILGYDTDLNFYRETDRRLDEYAWEGISGGLNTMFWAMAPKMMAAFSYIGETDKGGKALASVDNFIKGVNEWALENITEDYWNSLDEQGKEDLLDTMTTLEYMYGAKKVNNRTAKLKTTKIGSQYETLKAQNRAALERGFREAKNQAKAEVKNVKNATEVINGNTGKVTGKIGPEGEVGVAKSISRVVDSGVQGYKQYFIDRLNARHSGGINTPGTVPETGVTGAKPTEVPTGEKGVVGKTKDLAKQTWDNAITGLTPEERIRIQSDPYVADKFNKALAMINEAGMPLEDAFITEQLYNEIGDKIKAVFDERENKLGETSPYYREIRNNPTQYNLVQALPEISTVLTANDIVRDPISGELDFTNSKFVSDADMRSVQRALNMIEKAITKPLTPREYLNLRDKLKQLASYATVDASRGQSLIRQLRHTVNEVAHKTIPGLKDLDKVTSKYFNEIAELKDGWVYKGGDRKGEVRNNFYSIIKNLTGQNRKVMLDRLEKYYPGVGEEIEAIHIVNKMVKAYNKSPQMIKSMGIGGAFGGVSGGLVGGGIVGALIGAIAGEMINKGLIEPRTKKRRKLAIEKLISQLSPEAQRKLEAIAVRQMTAKEISAEDQAVLDKVAEIIMKERERGLSESALKEREQRTKGSQNPSLPGVAPDVVSPEGNITLGRGNPISPEKGPGRPKRLTQINEINLKKSETTPEKEVLDLQEKLDVDTETAQEIQNTVEGFLAEIGANEEGVISGREVNYNKFSTKALNELMEDNILPQSEKNKIENILKTRTAETEAGDRAELDKEFAYRIKKLEEEELRVGKIGKNKVSKEVAKKQQDAVDDKRDRLIEEMRERYGGNEKMDQERGQDKFDELSQKSVDYANSYKRTTTYRTETAERQVLDSLMEGWKQQPKFVRDMADSQLKIRQEFINELELQNGYKLETTDYNDRYILEDNGQIVDRGAIKYLEDGTIEVTAQSIDGLRDSGLLSYLPENAIIKTSGSGSITIAKELKGTAMLSKGDTKTWTPDDIEPASGKLYDIAEEEPIGKFTGKLTPEQKTEGNLLYKIAKQKLDGVDVESDNEIIAARGKFLVMNQKPGYTKALGLNQGEVNKNITEWWEENGGATEELKQFNRWINDGAKPQYWFTGISNLITYANPWRNIDAINYLVKDVKTAENFDKATYKPRIDATIDSLLLIDSHFNHGETNVRFTTQSEMNKYALELGTNGALGEFLGDTLTLIAGQGKETIPHETGHEADEVMGLELFGVKRVRKGGFSERYATGKAAKEYYKNNGWKWRDILEYKTPEAMEFHGAMLELLDKIKVPEWMKNDNSLNGDGKPMSEYRTRPEEVWARFWQANVTLTRQMNQTGKVPKKTYKSEHGDSYDIELYKEWAQLLQKHQELADNGAFYDVEPINRSGISTLNGLKDVEQKNLFEQTPGDTRLEKYFKEKPYNIDIMYKTYDPDILEWMNNIKKKFVGGEDITLNELYEVKNMMEQHSKEKGTQIDVPDGPTAQLLLEKAESMAKDKISTYDKKQIKKIGEETEQIIQNRVADADIRYDRGDVKDQNLRDIRADEFDDFKEQYIYQLGKTYNPDVEKWHNNLKKALKEITKEYEGFKGMTRFGNVVQTNGLNSLKAKIKELERYSYDDILEAFEGTYTDLFMRGVEKAKEELDSKEIEKAVTNLVALHNLDIVNFAPLIQDFKGKDPMPSIAVMDVNVPHEAFGDISLVFGRDTIDPKVDPANKLYGSDAWTPTFPEIKDKGTLGDYDKVKQMSSDVVDVLYNRGLDLDASDLGYFAEELKSQLLDIDGRADLEQNAERLAEQVFRDSVESLENDDYGIKNLSEKVADTGAENTVVDMLTDFIRESAKGEKVIPARYFDNGAMGYLDISKGLSVAERLSKMVSDDIVKEVIDTNKGLDWLPNKPETRKDVEKYYQSLILTQISDAVQRIEDIGIEPWKAKDELLDFLKKEAELEGTEVDNLVSEIFGNGIAGDRPLTPENVLEAMKNQKLNRPTYPGTFEDMIEIEGTELGDVEDVRRQNFAKVFHGDWTGDLGDLKQRYENLINLIQQEYVEFDSGIPEDTTPDAQVIRAMIKDEYSPNIDEFMENIEENPLLGNIPKEVAQRIIDVVEQGKKVPIRFSESKPERIVDLAKEVNYILVPNGKKADAVRKIVKDTPLEGKVVEYTPNDYMAPRSQKLKELQKKYGNVFFSMGGVIMPITMLYLMMKQEETA